VVIRTFGTDLPEVAKCIQVHDGPSGFIPSSKWVCLKGIPTVTAIFYRIIGMGYWNDINYDNYSKYRIIWKLFQIMICFHRETEDWNCQPIFRQTQMIPKIRMKASPSLPAFSDF